MGAQTSFPRPQLSRGCVSPVTPARREIPRHVATVRKTDVAHCASSLSRATPVSGPVRFPDAHACHPNVNWYLGFVWMCRRGCSSNRGPKNITGLSARWVQTRSCLHGRGFVKDAASFAPCRNNHMAASTPTTSMWSHPLRSFPETSPPRGTPMPVPRSGSGGSDRGDEDPQRPRSNPIPLLGARWDLHFWKLNWAGL